MSKKYFYIITALMMPNYSKEFCANRPHGTTNREIWEKVWERFNQQYTVPKYSEGFDCILTLTAKHNNYL